MEWSGNGTKQAEIMQKIFPHFFVNAIAIPATGKATVLLSALRPSGLKKWVWAPARKTRLAACGKPNALLALSKGWQFSFRKNDSRAENFSARLSTLFMVFCSSAQPTWSQNRYSITANWAREAVPWGFSVVAEVPLRMPALTAQSMAASA